MPGGCCSKTDIYVYSSHFLSAWGDRMWSFGVGIFLIYMSPDSLQLTAIYGLCMGFSVLLFGAFIGDIVDNTPRLKAAQVALVFQNSFVVVSATLIYLYLVYKDDMDAWGEWTSHVFYAITILLSILSLLNSIARSLAVEKDWIVEICKDDNDALASMTATLRRIDLTTQVLAPVATGVIMESAGVEIGALFIGGWNLISVVLEYFLLWKVYTTVPALRAKKDFIKAKGANEKDEPEEMKMAYTKVKPETEEDQDDGVKDESGVDGEHLEISPLNTSTQQTEVPDHLDDNSDAWNDGKGGGAKTSTKKGCCSKMLVTLERLYRGWPIYAKYPVAHAGMGLACMFLTVLGLDNVTVGYAKMQGVTESLLGVMQGVAAFFGIAGTLFYPVMRKRLGLVRTGIFGFSLLVMCIVPCVVSIWMPGSPFDLSQGYRAVDVGDHGATNCTQDTDQNMAADRSLVTSDNDEVPANTSHVGSALFQYLNTSMTGETTAMPLCDGQEEEESYISIWMLLAGIVTARFGLWIADLSITQLFLEEVKEQDRGKVNGVQRSLNQLMDLVKFLMVIIIPYQHQFGLAVLISFASICIGWCFYAYYLRKVRGHLMPHCHPQNGHLTGSRDHEEEGARGPGSGVGVSDENVCV